MAAHDSPAAPDLELAREFRAKPLGSHSAGLAQLLTLFRGAPMEGKYVLVCTEPHAQWRLGQLPGRRGEPVALVDDVVFHDRAEAEWEVFCRRWEAHFGERPAID